MTNRTWVIGVQWHPEVMTPADHKQLDLFKAFVEATKRYEASEADSKARTA
jgi:gamma-glutamyl-gamma-aminobutyrate hydrolase PuuD